MLCDAGGPVVRDENVNKLRGRRGIKDGGKRGVGLTLGLGL